MGNGHESWHAKDARTPCPSCGRDLHGRAELDAEAGVVREDRDPKRWPTPREFVDDWEKATDEKRLECAERIVEHAQTAYKCHTMNHDSIRDELEAVCQSHRELSTARDQERALSMERRAEVERLKVGLWNVWVALGHDTDGDTGPGALIAGMGLDGFIGMVVRDAETWRRQSEADYDSDVTRLEAEVKRLRAKVQRVEALNEEWSTVYAVAKATEGSDLAQIRLGRMAAELNASLEGSA